MRPVPPAVLALVKASEGFIAKRNPDPAGYAQIGYGHKMAAGDPLWDATLTEAQAEILAEADLSDAAGDLTIEMGPALVASLTDGQWGALVDFVFNEGIGRFATSTLFHLIQTGQMGQVAPQFDRWIYAGRPPVVMGGLVKRRAAEKAMWLS